MPDNTITYLPPIKNHSGSLTFLTPTPPSTSISIGESYVQGQLKTLLAKVCFCSFLMKLSQVKKT